MKRVCVVGSGGREHALARALGGWAEVVVCPGNAGMEALGTTCVPGPPERHHADLYVIGPEAPLVEGLADRLRAAGRLVLGPGADGARLEGSKAWMKDLLAGAGVPTAAYGVFGRGQEAEAVDFLRSLPGPWVVKTDGLAAGKGVLVTPDRDQAELDLRAKLSGSSFGPAGRRVVIEEHLDGREVSLMALCDGRVAVPLAAAQDHKRVGDGDQGPNTGGMGAFAPVGGLAPATVEEVMAKSVQPTLDALRDRGVDYRGVLYAGLMLTAAGPKVLEFNVRFGDPETQVVLPLWQGDVYSALEAAAAGRLEEAPAPGFEGAAVCVVLAAEGYPGSPRTGDPIAGLFEASRGDGVQVFSAAVGASAGGELVTAGGRVLGVTGTGADLASARERAYAAACAVSWPGMHHRSDIATTGEVKT